MRSSVVALLALGLAVAHGWAHKAQAEYGLQIEDIKAYMNGESVASFSDAPGNDYSNVQQYGWVWNQPENVFDERGLGGGITWAWDPELCSRLEPQFREDIFGFESFLGCDDYKAAVSRAFDKWSANNRFIKFQDVSNECASIGKLYGPPYNSTQNRPAYISAFAPFSEVGANPWHGGCPLAEIWVTQGLDTDGFASTAVATATQYPFVNTDGSFRFTNGKKPQYTNGGNRHIVEVYGGTLRFNGKGTNTQGGKDVCWYLDSQFCAPFHSLKQPAPDGLGSPQDARAFVDGMTYGAMALGIVFYIVFIALICLRAAGLEEVDEDGDGINDDDEDGDGQLSLCERVNAGVRAIAHFPPIVMAIFISLVIIPPMLNTRIFSPCFDCYDFEAAALHEIGHFLGLGHPDYIPLNEVVPVVKSGNNSYQSEISAATMAGTRPPASVCLNPWGNVTAGTPPGAVTQIGGGGYPVVNAQMEARTQHNPLACLTNDDLEAIATFYPDCGDFALYTNVCNLVQINIGIVRVSAYVLCPFIIALLAVICCSSIVHHYERRDKERLMQKNLAANQQKAAKAGGGASVSAAGVNVDVVSGP